MKIYLAGPMRGFPNFNFAAFDYAAEKLRAAGFEVFSPAERDRAVYGQEIENNLSGDESKVPNPACTINDCLAADMKVICEEIDAIAVLPGYEKSLGACAEVSLGRALGLTLIVLGRKFIQPPPELKNVLRTERDAVHSIIAGDQRTT